MTDKLGRRKKVTLGNIKSTNDEGKAVVVVARDHMLAPDAQKKAPMVTMQWISQVTNVHKTTISKQIKTGALTEDGNVLPEGHIQVSRDKYVPYREAGKEEINKNATRYFTCEEAAVLIGHFAPQMVKKKGVMGAIIAVCNYKGGVSKTSSAMCIAQALSLRGKRVLAIDLDPQGSLTCLHNFLHVSDVLEEDTALHLFQGKTNSIRSCIRKTYWPNIDLLPANSTLQGSEYAYRDLLNRNGIEAVGILNQALRNVMADYDVCIIDTPPSLNSMTVAALFAADGVVMPIPASSLELASAVQFWDMYIKICESMDGVNDDTEVFSFIKVIVPKYEQTVSCRTVLPWIQRVYGDLVSEITIPKSTAVARANDSFGTVFDVLPESNKKLLESQLPVRNAYEKIAVEIEREIQLIWEDNELETRI